MRWTTSWWFLSLCGLNGALGGRLGWPLWASLACAEFALAWLVVIDPHVRLDALERKVKVLDEALLQVQVGQSADASDGASPFL